MSADDTIAPIQQHTLDWQPWTHVCGRKLEMAWRYNGVQEYPLWRTSPDRGIVICPFCGATLRADQEQPHPL